MSSGFVLQDSDHRRELAAAKQRWFIWTAAAVIVLTWMAYAFRFRPDLLPAWLEHFLSEGLYGLAAPIKTFGGKSEGGAVAAWGQFGDFLGGMLNPILSFIALLVVARTLRLQAMQFEQSRRGQLAANTASQITALHSATDVLAQQIAQMQEVMAKGGVVSPGLYQNTLDRRDELARRLLELASSLLPRKT